jgi:hypothetical protein
MYSWTPLEASASGVSPVRASRGCERDLRDHYTPRDAIRLLVDPLFAEKDAA